MPEDAVKDSPKRAAKGRLTPSGALLLVTTLAASGALVALAVPRPVAPTEPPGLRLSEALAEEARRMDRALAAEAPEGLMAEQLLDAYYRHGSAERHGTTQRTYQHDRRVITRSVALLRQEHGDDALVALQASVVERLDDALAGRMEESERISFLGGFEGMMETYGLIADGEWLAPDVVVRALFKARFNATLRRPLTDGLHPIEVEAYWGWLALEAHEAPIDRRLEALDQYEEAVGRTFPEARGTLLFHAGEYLEAAERFEEAYAETGSIRLRNHAMAAMAEAEVSM